MSDALDWATDLAAELVRIQNHLSDLIAAADTSDKPRLLKAMAANTAADKIVEPAFASLRKFIRSDMWAVEPSARSRRWWRRETLNRAGSDR